MNEVEPALADSAAALTCSWRRSNVQMVCKRAAPHGARGPCRSCVDVASRAIPDLTAASRGVRVQARSRPHRCNRRRPLCVWRGSAFAANCFERFQFARRLAPLVYPHYVRHADIRAAGEVCTSLTSKSDLSTRPIPRSKRRCASRLQSKKPKWPNTASIIRHRDRLSKAALAG